MFHVEFYIWMLHIFENFGKVQILESALTIVKALFWVNLWNSFEFEETVGMEAFGVAKLESALKIGVSPFLEAWVPFLHKIFITSERRVLRTRKRLHPVSCRILHMDAAYFRYFWKG